MTLCFPYEIDEHRTFFEIGDMVDGAVPRDEYVDEMLALRGPDCPAPEIIEDAIAIYFPVSYDIVLSVPSSPTSRIFGIDDEIAQHDSDDDLFSIFNSDPMDQRVSPAIGDMETIDFGTADQPRELRIRLDLSTDERDNLIQLLRSYLGVFAWSYENMPVLDPSIVQHRLPLLPRARSVKQKLRRLYPRWSLQVKEEIPKNSLV
ncbi:hypothetical protein CK203_039456 [Vitis vinifera]|uniref:Uncharacterized protein n=1 Tax=Vitis vinifera TaxID=29760 RepID=A0A438I793_VITVI|nr:hypothetical protein CK203_039456 [Vitis vinifera]